MSTLYVVATPIGNLEDVTLRALRALREASVIAAEDTRVTRKLLARFEVDTPCVSYNEHNMRRSAPALLQALDAGGDVAVVSDAGTPGVNDPCAELVDAAARAGHRVEPIPGASALTAAISVAGWRVDRFTHLGFLPRQRGQRRRALLAFADDPRPLVAFESPHRMVETLEDALEVLGDRRLVACRELTKMHEEVFRGSVSEALLHFAEPRGEFTLIFEGAADPPEDDEGRAALAREILREAAESGSSVRDALAAAAAAGLPRNRLYDLWLEALDARRARRAR